MSVLEDLYNGKIKPSQFFCEDGSEYSEKMTILFKKYGCFKEGLSEEKEELIREIADIYNELSHRTQQESFSRGFRLGVQLMWEVFEGKSKDFI